MASLISAVSWDRIRDHRPYGHYFSNVSQEWDVTLPFDCPKDFSASRMYRVGPGLFQRGSDRKPVAIDADGMLREFHFEKGQVHFRNRLLKTSKLKAEEQAGYFLYPTLSFRPRCEVLSSRPYTPSFWGVITAPFTQFRVPLFCGTP